MSFHMRRRGAVLTFLLLIAVGVVAMTATADAAPAASLLQFTAGGHVLGFERGGLYVAASDHLLRIGFVGGASVTPAAGDAQAASGPGDVKPLQRVAYRGVWPGVSVLYESHGGAILESSYRVAAGSPAVAAQRITLEYNRAVRMDADGGLVIAFSSGELHESAPVAWQTVAGVRRPVRVAFRLLGDRRVGFAVGACDPRYPLVIDPSLTWVAFFGGGSDDYSRFLARDASGSLYVVGDSTASWQGATAPVNAYADKQAAYVAKLDSSGALLWNTFLGGTGDDTGNGIVLDAAGNVYATGTSDATWGAPVRAYSGGTDAWIAKLDPTTGVRGWNTFLGSADRDQGFSVAVGGSASVEQLYAGGWSNTSWGSPLLPHDADNDYCAFVAALVPATGALSWNTFLGPNGTSENPDTLPSTWLAADTSGNVYVSAVCAESWTVPGVTAVLPYTSGYDSYAAKLSSAGAVSWYTFLGGAGDDLAFGITAPDGSGDLYVSGSSTLGWGTLPVGGVAHTGGSNYDGFLAKLKGSTGVLAWTTFFGAGNVEDDANAVALDGAGNVYVGGTSWANWGAPIQGYSTTTDGFLAKFNTNGVRQWNTFMGGSGNGDQVWGLAVDADGNSYAAGYSNATWGTPVRAYTLGYDGFVAKTNTSGALLWNTFQGGGSDCFARWLTRDSSGNLFVVGDCTATWGTPLRAFQGTRDAFVAKMTNAGVLSWNTFLGGTGTEYGYGVVLDAGGSIYVTGTSTSTWPASPAPLNAFAGGVDVFVTKLTAAGVLSWNTFMGSAANDESFSLAISGSDLYVGGWSNATWGSPVRPYVSGYDAFVAKLTTAGAVTWNTFLGGYGSTLNPPNGIPNTWLVADTSGNVYVSAVCNAAWTDTGSTAVRAYSAGFDAYAVKLTPAGAVSWYTFLGGSGTDIAYGITTDAANSVYLSGSSTDTWGSPVSPHSTAVAGNYDAFAVKLNGSGGITWNTFFGSATAENDGNAVAVDSSGNVYVAGTSFGPWGIPWRAYTGGEAGFIAKFSSGGACLWNGFLGGPGKDDAWGLVLDGAATTAYVVGGSDQTWGSPVITSSFKAGTDGFVAAVSLPGAVWTGASTVDSNWSTAANWAGSVAPAGGGAVAFPVGAARKENVDDLLSSVGQVGFAESGYSVSRGGAITSVTLNDSITVMTSAGDNTWAIPSSLPTGRTCVVTTLSGTLTMSGAIDGAGTLSKNGLGSLTLSPANTYTGRTLINNGTLNASDVVADGASSLGNPSSGNLEVQIGAVEAVTDAYLNYTGGSASFTRGMSTLRGGGIVVATSGVTLTVETGGLTGTGVNLTLGGAGDLIVTSVISGTNGNVIKTGPGTLTLAGLNTYTGSTRISAGRVVADKLDFTYPGSLGQPTALSAKTIFLGDGGNRGTLQYTGPSISTSRSIVLGAGGGEIDAVNTLTLPGAISGTGGLTLSGGVFELGGTNVYSGDTTIAAGTVRQFFNNNRFPFGAGKGNLTVATGATLDTHGYGLQTNGLSGGGTITNTATAPGGGVYLSVGNNDASSTFSGVLSETNGTDAPLRLTKVGAGTLTLTGASTYTGYTAVTGGVLFVNGSVAAGQNVTGTVAAGATLGGSGAVRSVLVVNGVLAPGAGAGSIGTLETLRETWNAGGSYGVDLSDTTSGHDLLNVTGGLTVASTSGSPFTVRVANVGPMYDFDPSANYSWPIAQTTTGVTGFSTSVVALDTTAFGPIQAPTGSFYLDQVGATVYLKYTGQGTAVIVRSFGAAVRKGHVVATWKTAGLGTTVGFYLYRRIPATGKWRRITRALVPAQFGRPGGATYRVVDRTAPTGRRLTYRLKEVCFGSETNWYGPYRVKP